MINFNKSNIFVTVIAKGSCEGNMNITFVIVSLVYISLTLNKAFASEHDTILKLCSRGLLISSYILDLHTY